MAATLDLFCHQVVGWGRKPHLAVSCAAGYNLRWLMHAVAKLGIGPAFFCMLRMVLLPAMALRSA